MDPSLRGEFVRRKGNAEGVRGASSPDTTSRKGGTKGKEEFLLH